MADPFLAEIRIFAFNFPPRGWAFCDGQLLPSLQNTALYALLGTTYGSDGQGGFALPNLKGRAPMHPGQGTGLLAHVLGETGGSETVTLLQTQIPAHSHAMMASVQPGEDLAPGPTEALARSVGASLYQTTTTPVVPMSASAVTTAGGGQPHNNMMPYLTMNFCIALQGA